MIKKLYNILRVMPKLGYWNVAYMVWYRFSMKMGIRKFFFPTVESVHGTFFKPCEVNSNYPEEWEPALKERADQLMNGKLTWFFYHKLKVDNPPNWFFNPFNETQLKESNQHWTKIGDFNLNTGDIKIIWEPSRFYWVTTLARAYRVTGRKEYLDTINSWVNNWVKFNPINQGPNWKCGQETSIRMMNLLMTSFLMKQDSSSSESLKKLIFLHLRRIRPNIRYAIAQDNNHGTSEAAGLFIGGAWLLQNNVDNEIRNFARKCYSDGRKWLEERIKYLIDDNGSFSQHSTNYHRVLLDTLSLVEFWRKLFKIEKFSGEYYDRIDSAINWIEQMLDEKSGQVPNLGANDGAYLLNLHSCDYANFKPTIQTARSIYSDFKRFEPGPWDEPNYWLNFSINDTQPIVKETQILDKSYLIITNVNSWGMLRLPKFRFRPKHNDVFHFDLWYKGVNILCDSGSYSYFKPEGKTFKSVKLHNAVSFGSHEQMPQVSKFLLSDWIELDYNNFKEDQVNDEDWSGAYTDYKGNKHKRDIKKTGNMWMITDEVVTTDNPATLHWNFPILKENLILQGNVLQSDSFKIEINGGECISLEDTHQSKYYNKKHVGSRLSIVFNEKSKIETKIILK